MVFSLTDCYGRMSSSMGRFEGQIERRQVGFPMVLGIAVGVDGLDVATRLWLCSQDSILCVNCLVACARNMGCVVFLGLFPWLVVACALVVGLSLLVPLVAYARAVGGVWFVSP